MCIQKPQICRDVYRDRLKFMYDIRQLYDFDQFLFNYRPSKADVDVQKHFSIDYEVSDCDGTTTVFVRSKPFIGVKKTKWGDWVQMYPSLLDAQTQAVHTPTTIPPVVPDKVWKDWNLHDVKCVLGCVITGKTIVS